MFNGVKLNPILLYSQVLCLVEFAKFTERCEQALRDGNLASLKQDVERQLAAYTAVPASSDEDDDDDGKDSATTDQTGDKVLALKLKALVLDTIHNMHVVDQLIQANVRSPEDWLWQKQLRLARNRG